MIAKLFRFHGHGSLRYVYRHGKTVRGQYSALKFVANDKRKTYRLAVVVSKKVSKSAVVRNRIRRRLYEAVRLEAPNLKRPADMVLTVFSDQLADLPASDIKKIINDHLHQAGLI